MSLAVEHITHIYNEGSPLQRAALSDISFSIPDGQFVGMIGHTGSGKSTLIQHLNGLLRAHSGTVFFDGKNIYENGYPLKALRQQVGLVFQYPEHQLFEETVLKDVAFGPKNLGCTPEVCRERAMEALRLVAVPEALYETSPFELSGGQKRRVAIAGVLAMRPRFLILDEPTAGLDPAGKKEILSQIRRLHRETGMGVILVSHSMEDVAESAERILVLDKGRLCFDGSPRTVFSHYAALEAMGLAAPEVTYLMHRLREKGFPVNADITTLSAAADNIYEALSSC